MRDDCVVDLRCGNLDPYEIANKELAWYGMSVIFSFLAKFLDFRVFANKLVGDAKCVS